MAFAPWRAIFGETLLLMQTVASFESLKCWQASRALVSMVYNVSDSGKLARDFATKDQLRRAALSVMNNIAEGHGRGTVREFSRFLDIAHGSCTEVKSITYALEDLGYIPIESIEQIRAKADQVKGLVRGLIKYLHNKSEHQ